MFKMVEIQMHKTSAPVKEDSYSHTQTLNQSILKQVRTACGATYNCIRSPSLSHPKFSNLDKQIYLFIQTYKLMYMLLRPLFEFWCYLNNKNFFLIISGTSDAEKV